MKLKELPEVKFPNKIGGEYGGMDNLGYVSLKYWNLVHVEPEIRNRYILTLHVGGNVEAIKHMKTTTFIRSSNKEILERLKHLLCNHIGKTMEEIGEIEVDSELEI